MTSYAEGWKASDMTLRDYFAAQALGGILSDAAVWVNSLKDTPAMVAYAYSLADSMMKYRSATEDK